MKLDNDLFDAPDAADSVYMHLTGTVITAWLAYECFGAAYISDTVFCFYVLGALTWGGVAALAAWDWYMWGRRDNG